MSILKNIGANYLGIAIAGLSVIISVPVFSRNIEADLLAEVFMMLMILGAANIIDFFKFPIIVYFSSEKSENIGPQKAGLLIQIVFILTVFVAVFVAAFMMLSVFITSSDIGHWLYFLGSLLFLPSTNIFSSYLEAKGKIAVSSALRAVYVSAVYGGTAFLSLSTTEFACYGLLIFISSACYFILILTAVKKLTGAIFSFRVDRKFRKVFLGRAKIYLVFNLATYCVVYLDRIFLSFYGNASQFAAYSAVHEITSRFLVVYRGAAVPVLRDLRVRCLESKEKMIHRWSKVSLVSTFLVVLFYGLYLTMFQDLRVYDSDIIFYGKDILFFFAFGIAIQVYGYLFPLVLNAMGDFSTQTKVFVVISFLLVVLIYPMYALLDIEGIVILVVFTKLVYFGVFLGVAYVSSQENYESRRLLNYTFFNGVVLVALFIGAIYLT